MAAKEYYAVVKGHKTGIFKEPWETVQTYLKGFSGARYKGFFSRAEAEKWYAENVEAARPAPRGGIAAYVDGSNRADGSAASWAILICEEDEEGNLIRPLYIASGPVTQLYLPAHLKLEDVLEQRNILGEVVAAAQALVWFYHTQQKGTIFHDYEGLGMWAQRAWKVRSPLAQWYQEIAAPFVESGRVRFQHIKGHSGNTGNEIVDQLAGFSLGRGATLPKL